MKVITPDSMLKSGTDPVMIVQENKPALVSWLLDRYKSCYAEQDADMRDLDLYTVQNLS